MGHSSHEPDLYYDADAVDEEMWAWEEAWLASEQPACAPRMIPAHERPAIRDTEPFPEATPGPEPCCEACGARLTAEEQASVDPACYVNCESCQTSQF